MDSQYVNAHRIFSDGMWSVQLVCRCMVYMDHGVWHSFSTRASTRVVNFPFGNFRKY